MFTAGVTSKKNYICKFPKRCVQIIQIAYIAYLNMYMIHKEGNQLQVFMEEGAKSMFSWKGSKSSTLLNYYVAMESRR